VDRLKNSERGLMGFVSGVILTQFFNSAFHLAQPLLMAEITGSVGSAAFFASFDTAMHMVGTFVAGWPVDRFGARRVLVAATFLRGLILTAIPFAFWMGEPSAVWVMVWYTADAFVRGFVDASVFTLPMELAEHDSTRLDRLNSRYEIAFDVGGIAGPLALGGLMLWFHNTIAHFLIPIGFMLAAVAYSFIPQTPRKLAALSRPKPMKSGSWEGLRAILTNSDLTRICGGYMSFNVYPLRKLLSAFFAKTILLMPAASGTLGAAFSAGGLIGSLAYSRLGLAVSRSTWIVGGALGMVLLGFGWWPANLIAMSAAAFVFAALNTGARLTLIRSRQELTPIGLAGGVTAVSRFSANIVSVFGKALVGVAFTWGADPRFAFAIIGGIFATLALAQLLLARSMTRTPVDVEAPIHRP